MDEPEQKSGRANAFRPAAKLILLKKQSYIQKPRIGKSGVFIIIKCGK